jgi:hypothetical protein
MSNGRKPRERARRFGESASPEGVELFRRIAQLESDLRRTIEELQAIAGSETDHGGSRERLQHADLVVGALKDALAQLGEGQDEDATRLAIGQLEGELIIVERTLGGSRVH